MDEIIVLLVVGAVVGGIMGSRLMSKSHEKVQKSKLMKWAQDNVMIASISVVAILFIIERIFNK